MKKTPLNKVSKNEVKKTIAKLVKISHDFIRHRDSTQEYELKGKCFDCGKIAEGQHFQCGHFIPDSVGGAILRFHPHNMHGQASGCNMSFVQERVKIDYTFAMIKKYGKTRVEKLRQLKNKTIKADIIFYNKMIELYEQGDEQDIVYYLEHLI